MFETTPLASDLVVYGTASADLWLPAPMDDADIEVTITEVRPDGQEMYVQSGWLRASMRALAPSASELSPDHTFAKGDEALLEPGAWTQLRVGIAGLGHLFRAGSRLRVLIDTPGDSRTRWQFELKTFPGSVSYDVGHSASFPSSVALPVISGQNAVSPLPPCPSLRGQPCRSHQAYSDVPAP